MSTRCMIKICKKNFASEFVYHHCDGYPDGVGSELVKILGYYKTVEWTPNKISNALESYDSQYEKDGDINAHGDEDYLYIIDCDKKTIKCYEANYNASFDDLGEEVDIPNNIFTYRSKDESEDEKDDDFRVILDFDTYWESYMKIVSAMITCGENIEEVPELALKTLEKCMKFVYKN